MQKFQIDACITREDLEQRGFDAKNLSDEAMQKIADKMGKLYLECGDYWTDLAMACIKLNVPKVRSVT